MGQPWFMYPIHRGYTVGHGGNHDGYDFETPSHTPHTTLFGGVVTSHTGWKPWGGETDIKNPVTGLTETFAHQDRIDVRPGQVVWPGQQVGLSGGENLPRQYSTGPHTHYSIFGGLPWDNSKSIDPGQAIEAAKKGFGAGFGGTAGGADPFDIPGAISGLSDRLGSAIDEKADQLQKGVTAALHRIAFFAIGLALIVLGALMLLWPAIQAGGRAAARTAVTAAKVAL